MYAFGKRIDTKSDKRGQSFEPSSNVLRNPDR